MERCSSLGIIGALGLERDEEQVLNSWMQNRGKQDEQGSGEKRRG